MVGFRHLTDSHHYHQGQKPTMVGICHGGNMLGNHNEYGDYDDHGDPNDHGNHLNQSDNSDHDCHLD